LASITVSATGSESGSSEWVNSLRRRKGKALTASPMHMSPIRWTIARPFSLSSGSISGYARLIPTEARSTSPEAIPPSIWRAAALRSAGVPPEATAAMLSSGA
jgi:hypothetical protein